MTRLALFDLDNTLLSGDSELLWVDFLLRRGVLDQRFAARNAEMDQRYHAGEADASTFCEFFASTLAGRTVAAWQPLRAAFMREVICPRLPDDAHRLLRQHRDQGDLLVLTSASSRFLIELTAVELGFEHVIATELEVLPDGCLAGRTRGILNMREGKLVRLREWLVARELPADDALRDACFYSDSINDLALLSAVGHPVVVDPDVRLEREARARHWPVLRLSRSAVTALADVDPPPFIGR